MWKLLCILAFLFTVLFLISAGVTIEYIEDHGFDLTTAWIFSGVLYNPMIVILAYTFSGSLQMFIVALVVYDMVVPIILIFQSLISD